MPKGIYKRKNRPACSEETKKKISLTLQGHIVTEETRKKLSEALKGRKPSKETLKKIFESRKGYRHSEETKNKSRKSMKQWHNKNRGTLEYKKRGERISKSNMGRTPWNKDKINLNAGTDAIHIWVRKRKPKPKFCVECKKVPPRDLSNISGEYKRDVNDFEWLCRKCHMTKDGRIKSIKENNKKYGKLVKLKVIKRLI